MLDLALRNLRRSWQDYLAYFISLSSIATLFYLFISLRYNSYIAAGLSSRRELGAAGTVASILILLIGFDFAWYSSDFFLRKRYREMGLYSLYGLPRKAIGSMMILENAVLGFMAFVVGVSAGYLLSKLFVMAVLRIIGLDTAVRLSLEPLALRDTAFCFSILLLPVALRASWMLGRFELASLFRAEKSAQEAPRTNTWIGFLSLAALLGGYSLAFSSTIATVVLNFFIVATITTLASYGMVHSFLPWLLGRLRNNRSLAWKHGQIIAWSQLEYRIRSNIKLFVNISIIGSAAMIALGFGFNAMQLIENTARKAQPWDLSFISDETSTDLDEKVRSLLSDRGHTLVASSTHEVLFLGATDNSYQGVQFKQFRNGKSEDAKVGLVASDFNLQNPEIVPFMEAVTVGVSPTTDHRILSLPDGGLLQLDATIPDAPLNLNPGTAHYLVFVDDMVFARYAQLNGTRLMHSYNYKVKDREAMQNLGEDLSALLGDKPFYSYDELAGFLRLFRLYLFLGFLSALVFLGAASSILFFKQMAETRADEQRFRILLNLGAPRAALSRVISMQTLPLFIIPLVLGMLHSLVALTTMSIVLKDNFVLPIAVTLTSYAILFLGLGTLTTGSYRNAVLRSS